MKIESVDELEKLTDSLQKQWPKAKRCITICAGTGCRASGAETLIETFNEEINKSGLKDDLELKVTGCHGFCERGPLVVINPQGVFYQLVKGKHVPGILNRTIEKGELIDELLYSDPTTGEKIAYENDIPFYKRQKRLILGNNGIIEPTNFMDYITIGGYGALGKALTKMDKEAIIDEVKKSGLRGRGGAGFPAGLKWEITKNAKGNSKYIVCNADEGDPGAYMDRSILEGNPHSVIEGMLIGAYAIGANEGFVYVRNEYPLAVKTLTTALEQAREHGLVGEKILGTDFEFNLRIVRGAGAFVCGEETALMASVEGRKGVPRQRPPFPSVKGIWGRPTNINNVETWANVPLIISRGSEWFSKIGTEGSKGTKIFSLVGNINNTGLVEVPMGTTLAQIVHKIGGGVPKGKKLKAIQIGGPSGGCLPRDLIGMPIDFDVLQQLGSMMGSGGMVVMDEDTCMVDVARYFLKFLLEESCGKCVTCRDGIERLLEIVTRITEGNGCEEDLPLIEELANVVKDASMCGLGQTAPNPVLSTMRYFKDEYLTHIRDKRCPAGVCRELIIYSILEDKCNGCGACRKLCPKQAISGEMKELHTIDLEKCIKCGICYETCKFDAIARRSGVKKDDNT